MFNITQFLVFPSLRLRKLRAALITLGIAIGVALYVAIDIINQSTLASFRSSVSAIAGKTQLTVTAGEAGFAEEKLDIVAKTPGVRAAVPLILSRGYFAGSKGASTLQILGVDLLKEQSVRAYKLGDEEVIDDPLVFLNQADSIILTKEFAAANRLGIDSQISLATTKGKQIFTVRGLLTPEGPAKAYGGAIAIMDIDGARVMLGKENKIDRIDVIAQTATNLGELSQRISERLGDGFRVERPDTQSEDLERMVSSFQAMLSMFSTLALAIGLFMVFNLVNISVAERKREVGMLRALGASRWQVLTIFVSESLFFGVVGSSLGALCGWLLSFGLVEQITRSLASQFLVQIEVPRIIFTHNDFLKGLLLGTASAVIAALWPSWHATRIQPVEAFTPRGVDTLQQSRRLSFFGPTFGCILLISCLLVTILCPDNTPANFHTLFLAGSLLGAVLFLPAVMIKLLRKQKRWKPSMLWRMALNNLVDQRRRTVSNLSILLIGLSFVVLISTVESSFRGTAQAWIDRMLKHDLIISSQGKIITFDTQLLDESVMKEVGALPGVKEIEGRRTYSTRFVRIKYQNQQIAMKAIDPPNAENQFQEYLRIDGPAEEMMQALFRDRDPPRIIVSENFVLHFKLKTGDTMALQTPSGEKTFLIAGITRDLANPIGVLYIDRAVYKEYWNDTLINAFGIYLDGVSAVEMRHRIDSEFGQKRNLLVQLNSELKSQMHEVIGQSFTFIRAIEIAALAVTLLGILNTVLVSVLERTREFALLRAVGMTRAQLFNMILREVLLQGLLGAVSAIFLGTILSFVWVQLSLSAVLGWKVDFYFPWNSALIALGLGICVAVIAGLWPAKKATDISISQALSYE